MWAVHTGYARWLDAVAHERLSVVPWRDGVLLRMGYFVARGKRPWPELWALTFRELIEAYDAATRYLKEERNAAQRK